MSTAALPPLANKEPYIGRTTFFENEHPLDESIGYIVVLGFGAFFSVFTTLVVYIDRYFGSKKAMTSEHFK